MLMQYDYVTPKLQYDYVISFLNQVEKEVSQDEKERFMEEGMTFSRWKKVIRSSCRDRDIFTYDGKHGVVLLENCGHKT